MIYNDLIKKAKELGFDDIWVNTNGIRLAEDYTFFKKLINAGLTNVFLQFDGIMPDTYKKIRGRDIFQQKQKVIKNCRKIGKCLVTLVATIAKGINEHEIPNILDFAAQNSDVVGQIEFQPLSFCGRNYKKHEIERLRITTSYIKSIINKHTKGAIKNWYPWNAYDKLLKLINFIYNEKSCDIALDSECGSHQIIILKKQKHNWIWSSWYDMFDIPSLNKACGKIWDKLIKNNIHKNSNFWIRKKIKLLLAVNFIKYLKKYKQILRIYPSIAPPIRVSPITQVAKANRISAGEP